MHENRPEGQRNSDEREHLVIREPQTENQRPGPRVSHVAGAIQSYGQKQEQGDEEIVEREHLRGHRVGKDMGREREEARGQHAGLRIARPFGNGERDQENGERGGDRREQVEPPGDGTERQPDKRLGE